jgi:hypothetical protein
MCRTSITRSRSNPPHTALALSMLVLSACSGGTAGPPVTEQRGVDAFHSIDLRGAGNANVTVGPAASVTLVADARTLKATSTAVRNGMLIIENRPGWSWLGKSDRLEMRITLPTLNALALNGAGNIGITGVHGQALSIALQGAGNLVASGETAALNARLNGAGNLDLARLVAGDATLAVNGAGNLTAHVTGSLLAEVNGVGSISYSGKPRQVESNINGVGRIVAAPAAGPE